MAESTITRLVGIPFVNGGRNVRTGLDCWGLVREVFMRFGIKLPEIIVDFFAYDEINALINGATATLNWELVEHITDKDVPLVVLMRIHPKYITHAGVYVGNNKIMHTMEKTGVVMVRASTLRNQIAGYYRYVEDN